MKKIFLATLVFANLSLTSIACEFHDGQYFSRYEWPRVSYNMVPAAHINTATENTATENTATEKVETTGQRKQPDFRYSRTQSSTDRESNSNQDLSSNTD